MKAGDVVEVRRVEWEDGSDVWVAAVVVEVTDTRVVVERPGELESTGRQDVREAR